MSVTTRVDTAPASLLKPGEAPPRLRLVNGSVAPPGAAAPPPAPGAPSPQGFTQEWVRQALVYASNAMSSAMPAEIGPKLRLTQIELGFLVPPITAQLNRVAVPALGESPEESVQVLWVIVGVMVVWRGVVVWNYTHRERDTKPAQRQQPATSGIPGHAAPAPARAAAPVAPPPEAPPRPGSRNSWDIGGRVIGTGEL